MKLIIIIGVLIVEVLSNTQNICQNEEFTASCNDNEVVVMTVAKYGRMKVSRCVEKDFGYIGCGSEMLKEADRFCSGKRKCVIDIPNTPFDDVNKGKCPLDLKSYLTADYNCVKVFHSTMRRCPISAKMRVTSLKGHLASILTQETDIGSTKCPYVIEAPPWAIIKFSLLDFNTTSARYAYATIKEEHPYKMVTVFASESREVNNVYTSQSNKVEVRIMQRRNGVHAFILKYEVVGCSSPPTNAYTTFKRKGNTGVFSCKDSGTSWKITCSDHVWKGRISNCSNPVVGKVQDPDPKNMSHKWSLILVTVIALALGATILTVGILILKWKRTHRSPYEDVYPQQDAKFNQGQQQPPRDQYGDPTLPQMTQSMHDYGYSKENEYAYISDFPPSMYERGTGRSIEERHMELYQARMCRNPYGTYAHGQSQQQQIELGVNKPTVPPPPIGLPSYYELDTDGRKVSGGSAKGRNSGGTSTFKQIANIPPPVNNDLPLPAPSAYDHLINAGCTSNHKSV